MQKYLKVKYSDLANITSLEIAKRILESDLCTQEQSYNFEELDNNAKENAYINNLNINVSETDWIDKIEEEADKIGFFINDTHCNLKLDAFTVCEKIIKNYPNECQERVLALKTLSEFVQLDKDDEDYDPKFLVIQNKFKENLFSIFFNKIQKEYRRLRTYEEVTKTIIEQKIEFDSNGNKFKN